MWATVPAAGRLAHPPCTGITDLLHLRATLDEVGAVDGISPPSAWRMMTWLADKVPRHEITNTPADKRRVTDAILPHEQPSRRLPPRSVGHSKNTLSSAEPFTPDGGAGTYPHPPPASPREQNRGAKRLPENIPRVRPPVARRIAAVVDKPTHLPEGKAVAGTLFS